MDSSPAQRGMTQICADCLDAVREGRLLRARDALLTHEINGQSAEPKIPERQASDQRRGRRGTRGLAHHGADEYTGQSRTKRKERT
jgi:hypothetical protein